MSFVPEDFKVPEKVTKEDFIIRKLCARDSYLDYMAVMSSIEIIKKTRGGEWPYPELTFEDDMIDLAWHQREFEGKRSFAFTVMSADETECFGCIYIYPPGFRSEIDISYDADISFWVTQKKFDEGFYKDLYNFLKNWIKEEWPFQNPFWSNTLLLD